MEFASSYIIENVSICHGAGILLCTVGKVIRLVIIDYILMLVDCGSGGEQLDSHFHPLEEK